MVLAGGEEEEEQVDGLLPPSSFMDARSAYGLVTNGCSSATGPPTPTATATALLQEPQINGIRTYRSGEEYLIAMREDLAEWLATLYGPHLAIDYDNFFELLENGVVLCQVSGSS